jgi:peroxiredoxin
MSQLQARNAAVFGVSADTVESHKQFAEKEKLNFPLLADPEAKVIEAYGALMPGRKMANRFTFIIGPDGKIIGIDRNVNNQFARTSDALTSEHGLKLALALTDWKAKPGAQVPYFSLPTAEGKTVGFAAGKKATAVVFLGAKDPASLDYVERLSILASDPAYKDVAILGIASNRDDSPGAVKQLVMSRQITFPVALDQGNKIADHFGAEVTPSVWVLDAKGTVLYHGAIDDNRDGGKVNALYLKDALDAALAGKTVAVAETKAVGSRIKRSPKK